MGETAVSVSPILPASLGSVLRERGSHTSEHSTFTGLTLMVGGHAWSQGRVAHYRGGGERMWPLAPTCIMAPIISVTFLGISLNGGKTYVWRQREKRDCCILRPCFRASFTLNTFRERGTQSTDISYVKRPQ